MKLTVLFIALCLAYFSFSQEEDSNLKTNIQLGTKYTFIDDRGGGCLGIVVSKEKFDFSLRNDFSLELLKPLSAGGYIIKDYQVSMYFDVAYHLYEKSYPFAGLAWISNTEQIHRFNTSSGYYGLTLGWRQDIGKRLTAEFRGDIGFIKRNALVDQNIQFPVAISILYKLNN